MTTPEQRAQNRAKFKRWYDRHVKGQPKKTQLFHKYKTTGKYRTFELDDPRDPDQPKIVGYGLVKNDPVWEPLWSVRYWSHSKWASWLRELDLAGLEPVERVKWSLGRFISINRALAHDLVTIRLRDINEKTTGNPLTAVTLRNVEAIQCKDRIHTPVACVRGGVVSRYGSVAEAARANGITTEVSLRHWIWAVEHDPQGNLWFDD